MQKDNIEVYNAIMGLIKIKYNTFNFDSFESVMNIYGTLIAVSVNTKSRRIITNNFRHDSVPSIQSSFLPGCIVIIKGKGKKGVIVEIKNGGWRKVISDGKCSSHRPGELLSITTSKD